MSLAASAFKRLFPTAAAARWRMAAVVWSSLFKAWRGHGLAKWQRQWPWLERCGFIIARDSTLHAFGLGKADGSGMAQSRQLVNATPWKTPVTRQVDLALCPLAIAPQAIGQPATLDCLVLRPRQVHRFVYFLHGGGYAYFSPAHINLLALAATQLEAEVWAPAYRLAPEHPWPAQIDDALAGYHAFCHCHPGVPVVAMGDSSGGHLLIHLLAGIARQGAAPPMAAIALSPWLNTDPAQQAVGDNPNDGVDWIFGFQAERWARWCQSADTTSLDALIAGAEQVWPPLLIQYGSKELLAPMIGDAAAALLASSRQTRVRFDPVDDMPHDFQAFAGLPQAQGAWRTIFNFVADCGAGDQG